MLTNKTAGECANRNIDAANYGDAVDKHCKFTLQTVR